MDMDLDSAVFFDMIQSNMDAVRVVTLTLSGILLSLVGLSRLNYPLRGYYDQSKKLPSDLLSDVRGIGGIQLCSGAVTLYGGYVSYQLSLSNKTSEADLLSVASSHIIGIITLGGFGIGKFLSMLIDDGGSGGGNKTGLVLHMLLHVANIVCFIDLLYQYEMMT